MAAMNGQIIDISTPPGGNVSVRSSPLETTIMDIEPQEVPLQLMASSSRTLNVYEMGRPGTEKEELEKQVMMLTNRLNEINETHHREK